MNRFFVSLIHPNGDIRQTQVVYEGMTHIFSIVSPFLVSAGQTIDIGVHVRPALPPGEPGDFLVDATGLKLITIDRPWWLSSIVPSKRTLSDVLQDAVQHGVDNPTHGYDCICMDEFIRELRVHINRATPPTLTSTDDAWIEAERTMYLKAIDRIGVILHQLSRNL